MLLFSKVSSESQLSEVVAEVLNQIQSEKIILCLEGALGAGKTTFAKALCAKFGFRDVVSSSFALHNQYVNSQIEIDHWDLYRLTDEDELESSGFWDQFYSDEEKPRIILIEWASRLDAQSLPGDWMLCELKLQKNDQQCLYELRSLR